eukprot:4092091-Pleurochrysis_carterae.AAC.1
MSCLSVDDTPSSMQVLRYSPTHPLRHIDCLLLALMRITLQRRLRADRSAAPLTASSKLLVSTASHAGGPFVW